MELKETNMNAPRGENEKGTRKVNRKITSHSLMESSGSDESDIERNSSLRENMKDPKWTPGLFYARK